MIQHKHLIVRAELDNCPDNEPWIEEWLINLVDLLGMKILAGPIVARVDDVEGNIGCTGVVIIETSHIAVHFWEETGLMQLDVYTCGHLDKYVILDELQYMMPTKVEWKFLDREHGLVIVN
jgi:S-adenosylmethionine decarboxylase